MTTTTGQFKRAGTRRWRERLVGVLRELAGEQLGHVDLACTLALGIDAGNLLRRSTKERLHLIGRVFRMLLQDQGDGARRNGGGL